MKTHVVQGREDKLGKPNYTLRANGKKMVTILVPFAVSQEAVVWAAEKLGTSEEMALSAIRQAYNDAVRPYDLNRVLTLDPTREPKIALVEDTERDGFGLDYFG